MKIKKTHQYTTNKVSLTNSIKMKMKLTSWLPKVNGEDIDTPRRH